MTPEVDPVKRLDKLSLMSFILFGQVIGAHNYSFRGPGIRILFDLSFFIVITTIGLNIIFGIIVDTFSELRDEKVHFCIEKKGSKTKKRMKEEEKEKGDCGPPTRKVFFSDFVGLEPSGT